MRILLVSTYELGHQPVHIASPAAALRMRGHDLRCLDLSVQKWDPTGVELASWAEAAAFSVPMHTAMRLTLEVIPELRKYNPTMPVCVYGLYAGLAVAPYSRLETIYAVAGEYEPSLVQWAEALAAGEDPVAAVCQGQRAGAGGQDQPRRESQLAGLRVDLRRHSQSDKMLPARDLLPPLQRYAKLLSKGTEQLAGYVEASTGCSHRCRHCPVPVIYDGRMRSAAVDNVLADIEQLVAMGAKHVSFGDPDFLNAPQHALRVVRATHDAFPQLTFDATVKVEHVLRHETIWPEMSKAGCLFVVSAFESTDDEVLAKLAKGHTVSDAARAVEILREQGIEPRPSFVPFTPWTTRAQIEDLFEFVYRYDLVYNVDPVQYGIRLLVPPGSLLVTSGQLDGIVQSYDPDQLGYPWKSPDPWTDMLQVTLAKIAEEAAACEQPVEETFEEMVSQVTKGRSTQEFAQPVKSPTAPFTPGQHRPRLSEAWFCCAEPTEAQHLSVAGRSASQCLAPGCST
ncbi:MAG: CUAEP/CCAEP-tail radical SAM protein [Actinobacteria bacterium]|nr:CUAEP/CCAEP-tail radical SAM protein [Actinomycetota bacterium]